MTTVTPIGTARKGYRVHTNSGSFDVRTTSPRRYLVVSLRGQHVVKRTDSRDTAERERRKDGVDRIVVDRRIVDAVAAQLYRF